MPVVTSYKKILFSAVVTSLGGVGLLVVSAFVASLAKSSVVTQLVSLIIVTNIGVYMYRHSKVVAKRQRVVFAYVLLIYFSTAFIVYAILFGLSNRFMTQEDESVAQQLARLETAQSELKESIMFRDAMFAHSSIDDSQIFTAQTQITVENEFTVPMLYDSIVASIDTSLVLQHGCEFDGAFLSIGLNESTQWAPKGSYDLQFEWWFSGQECTASSIAALEQTPLVVSEKGNTKHIYKTQVITGTQLDTLYERLPYRL